jgi:HD-GYP domain-containing protein (c-di-GMP phosphodiesterase class II)
MAASDLVLDFLEFVERQPRQSVRELLDKILKQSRTLTGAEAGTIFIVRSRGGQRWLEPASIQNDVIRIAAKAFIVPITPKSIAGFVAGSGDSVVIDDVYQIPSTRPYGFNPANELKGYKTHSMLCFALKGYDDRVIGVVQLINRRAPGNPEPIPFDQEQARLIAPIARVVSSHIERADMLERIAGKNATLRARNRELAEQRAQVVALQAETEEAFMLSIQLLARAAEVHDEGTGNHIVRVNEYSYFVAQKLGMPKAFCDEIHYSAQLHDVGKMSVDSAVLKKKGKLEPAEREEMNNHSLYGYRILEASPRLKLAAEIALNHHEKWDGTGYPNKRKGDEIPISARIVALADIYDALRSERPYKPSFSHEKTCSIILDGDDRIDPRQHFDPALLDLYREHHAGMAEIWDKLHD